MQKWYDSGYFNEQLQIKLGDSNWIYLRDYLSSCHGSPFLANLPASTQYISEYYDSQRQNQLRTPIQMNGIPYHPNLIIQQPNVSSPPTYHFAPPNSSAPFYINPNSSYSLQPLMMVPPGIETYDESQMYHNNDVYGNGRENPSSSSVSETPDSERCLRV